MQRLLAVQQFLVLIFLDFGNRPQLLFEGLELSLLFHGPKLRIIFSLFLRTKN